MEDNSMTSKSNLAESIKTFIARPVITATIVIFTLVALALAIINFSTQKVAELPTDFTRKSRAYNFVAAYGTYDSSNYSNYVESMKNELTPEYYSSQFAPTIVDYKREYVLGTQTNYSTLPAISVDEIELINSGQDSFTAKVYAEEEKLISEEESYFQQVEYLISFVKQNGKFVVNNIVAERASDTVAHQDQN